MSKLFKTLKDTGAIRWVALLCLALPMFASYFFDDIFSTINQEFEDPSMVALGWSMADYGFYRSAYSLLCIFGGLIICGMLLDRWGVRLTGSIFVGLMVGGAALITYAISESFAGSRLCAWLSVVFAKPSLSLAYAGCAMFGLGSEIAGVTVNRAIAKWFKGREIALAMGLQLALARLGTAVALIVVPRIVELEGYIPFSETSKPAVVVRGDGLWGGQAGGGCWFCLWSIRYRFSGRGPFPFPGCAESHYRPAFYPDFPALRILLLLRGVLPQVRHRHPHASLRH